MVKYHKKVHSEKLHLPKSIREEFPDGTEAIIQPDKDVFIVYKEGLSAKEVRKSLDFVKHELTDDV